MLLTYCQSFYFTLVGVLVDRYDRKKLLWMADIINIILVSLVPILHALHLLEVWHLYVITFILAVMCMLFDVTTVTVIPHIAGASLTKANSLYQMVNQLASLFWSNHSWAFHIFYWRLSSTLD